MQLFLLDEQSCGKAVAYAVSEQGLNQITPTSYGRLYMDSKLQG